MRELTISASGLGDFYVCPARWRYSRELRYLGPEPSYFKFGHEVHGLMDGSIKGTQASPAAVRIATRLLATERRLGLVPVGREVWQQLKVAGMTYSRKLDLLATDAQGDPLIVDYKTASKPWKVIASAWGAMAPKGLGFQAIGYLIPPERDNPFGERWPYKITFLVAPSMGRDQEFTYYWQDRDMDNLLDAIEHVKAAVKRRKFPKVRGYSCEDCAYAAACYQSPGWTTGYKPTGLRLTDNEEG